MKYLEQHIAGRHPYCSHCGKEIELIAREDLPSMRTILSFRHFPGGVNWSKEIGYDQAINEFVPPPHRSEMIGQVISGGVHSISRHCQKVWKKPKPAQIDYDWNVDGLVGLAPKDVEKTQEALGKAIAESFEEYVASQIIPQGFPSPAAPGVTVNKPYQHGPGYDPQLAPAGKVAFKPRDNRTFFAPDKKTPVTTNRNIVRKILL